MRDRLFEVTGRVVMVTGASSGIGLHLCRTFATRGAHVLAVSRSAGRSSDLADLAVEFVSQVTCLDADVTSASSMRAALADCGADALDVLVNCAGATAEGELLETSDEDWERVLRTNLLGPLKVVSACRDHLVGAVHGSAVVNVLSIAGVAPIKGLSAYGASKAALAHLTRSMALELAQDGVRVNAVLPGYVATPMTEAYLRSGGRERLERRIALGRVGDPEDLDGAVLFLASAGSAYVTGASIVVDGGYLL